MLDCYCDRYRIVVSTALRVDYSVIILSVSVAESLAVIATIEHP